MHPPPHDALQGGVASLLSGAITRIMGFSLFASLFQRTDGYAFDTARLFVLGSLIEGGRRFFQWLVERVRFRSSPLQFLYSRVLRLTLRYVSSEYSITAQFTEGDPTYEWIVMFLVRRFPGHRVLLPRSSTSG